MILQLQEKYVFTNRYGLARSIIAFGNLISFAFTSPADFFPRIAFTAGMSKDRLIPNLFHLMGYENLELSFYISMFVMAWVISGYLPQITGILHAWVVYSFFTGALLVEGGDQIAQIITILLIPVTLLDKRINHWHTKEYLHYRRSGFVEYICYSFTVIIRIQMAIVYLIAGGGKMKSDDWMNGGAFYYWFDHVPFGASGIIKTIFYPLVSNQYIVPLITWGAIGLECILFAALFMEDERKKRLLFWLGVSFHLMIVLIHGLVSFYFSMLGGLILYLLPIDKPVTWPDLGIQGAWKALRKVVSLSKNRKVAPAN